jgi:hypothetical protein
MAITELADPRADSFQDVSQPAIQTSIVVGWGVDANPQNDPTYPYRDRSADNHSGEWLRPTQQQPEVEVLRSIEHKRLPAVFGTASPPKWISGWIRRLAFRWSESNWAHWMLLMGADRVNMIEGLVEDLAHVRIPNIPKEMGMSAEWKYNKVGLAKKLAIATLIGGVALALIKRRQNAED